jgi:hypothetical protein
MVTVYYHLQVKIYSRINVCRHREAMSISVEFQNSILMVCGSFRRRMVPWGLFWSIFVEEKQTFRSYVRTFGGKCALLIILLLLLLLLL